MPKAKQVGGMQMQRDVKVTVMGEGGCADKGDRNVAEPNWAETGPNKACSSRVLLEGRGEPNASLHERTLPLWKAGGSMGNSGKCRPADPRLTWKGGGDSGGWTERHQNEVEQSTS